jgi:hypothetical protein
VGSQKQINYQQYKRKVENLPRTGIEYPMMKDLGHAPFIVNQREFEPLCERSISQQLLDEYIKNDADRTVNCSSNQSFQVVFDYVE